MRCFIVFILSMAACNTHAEERQVSSAADILRKAVEEEHSEAVFRVDSDEAGQMVSAHDVEHGLHHFYEEDIVSAFIRRRPLTTLFVVAILGLVMCSLCGGRRWAES